MHYISYIMYHMPCIVKSILYVIQSTSYVMRYKSYIGELIRNLRSYEIDFPIITDNEKSHLGYLTNGASRRRRKRAINTVGEHDPFHYKFRANGEDHYMKLRMNTDLFGPDFKVEHFYGDEDVKANKMEDHCYLVGETFPQNYSVAISDCDGLFGVIETKEDMLFIEPLVNDSHVDKEKLKGVGRPHLVYKHSDLPKLDQRFDLSDITRIAPANERRAPAPKRDIHYSYVKFYNKSGRIVKLMWVDKLKRRSYFATLMPGTSRVVNTFTSHRWVAVDELTGIDMLVGHKMVYAPRKNSRSSRTNVHIKLPRGVRLRRTSQEEIRKNIGSKYIEAMVVADKSVVDFHGKKKAERYVMALMNIVSQVFKDSSLGVEIHYVLVRIVLLHKNPKEVVLNPRNPNKSLLTACDYMHKIKNGRTDRDPHFHDHATFLTRRPFGTAAGYAPVYGMCHPVRSCTINGDDGFPSAFIIAHEVGHSLGMEHDGESNNCKSDTSRGSIMAPLVQSRMNQFFWSSCSRKEITNSIRNFHCLEDKPGEGHKKNLPYMHKYVGFHYTADDQCRFDYGDGFSFCKAFYVNPCTVLWCNMPRPYSNLCKSIRAPALDGTECGHQKWCLKGRCVKRSGADLPKPIDGKWSKWGAWKPCSKDCGVGLTSRLRQCNNPAPKHGGKDCVGEAIEHKACNTKICEQTVLLHSDEIKKQCPLVGKQRNRHAAWSHYDESKVNLNCTFEHNFCSWINLRKTDQRDWTLNRGATKTKGTGPSVDHTKKNARGQYIYFESSSPAEKGDKARLSSPDMAVRRGCLSFWYHILGSTSIGTLRVITISKEGTRTLWSKNKSEGDKWIEAHVDIQEEGLYQLIIEVERANGYKSDFAVDDITFTTGQCQGDNSYEEKESTVNPCVVTCVTDDHARSIQAGVPVMDGLRCYDNGSLDICMDGKCRNVGCDGVLDSQKEYDNCGVCGGDGSSCKRKDGKFARTIKEDPELLLSIPEGSSNIRVTKRANPNYLLVLTVKDPKRSGRKIKVINGGRRQSSPAIYSTNGNQFVYTNKNGEETIMSLGMVKQDVSISIKMYKNEGTKSSVSVQYQYFGTKNPGVHIRGPEVTTMKPVASKLTTQPLQSNEQDLIRWVITDKWRECSRSCGIGRSHRIYFCKRGDSIVGRSYCKHLKLTVKKTSKLCNTHPCGVTYYWQANPWSKCSKTCSVGLMNREVVCRKRPGNNVVSASLCKGEKPKNTKTCLVKACRPQWSTGKWSECSATCGLGVQTRDVFCINDGNRRTNGCDKNKKPISTKNCQRPACSKGNTDPLDCDFEKDLCEWKQMKDDDFDWIRNRGKTKSSETGPTHDHTLQNQKGHYLFIEASNPQQQHHKARLISPEMTARRACLKFYYHMHGSHIGKLKVKLLTKGGYMNEYIWRKRGRQENRWMEAQVDISIGLSYKIVIEGVRGNGWRGDIAIDDITFRKTKCAQTSGRKNAVRKLR